MELHLCERRSVVLVCRFSTFDCETTHASARSLQRAPCNRVAATYDYHTKNAQTAAKRSAQNDKRAPNPATTTVESAVAAPRFLMRWNVLGAQLTAVYGLA